jgi:hypothetical protein
VEGWGCCLHSPHPGELPQEMGSVVAVAAAAVAAAAVAVVMPGRPGPGPGPEPEPGPLLLLLLLPALVAGDQEGYVCAYVS